MFGSELGKRPWKRRLDGSRAAEQVEHTIPPVLLLQRGLRPNPMEMEEKERRPAADVTQPILERIRMACQWGLSTSCEKEDAATSIAKTRIAQLLIKQANPVDLPFGLRHI